MTLLEEINAKCTPEQIASGDYDLIASIVNVGRDKILPLMISERGIIEKYPDGPLAADTVLSKLEAFSQVGHPMSSIIKRALKFLEQPEGIDIGSPTVQNMITQLGAGGVITSDEATKLKSIAPIYLDRVTADQCREVLTNNP